MASLGTVFVDVKMDENQVRSESRRVGAQASQELGKAGATGGRQAGDEFTKSFGSSSGRIRGVGADLGKSLLAGFAGIGVGVAIGKVFSTGISELTDYQQGLAQLQAGLKSTGGVAGITADQMENLASQIQGYSGQTDDSIVKTESLLLTFTKIRNVAGKNNDIFTQTTKIAADMAARMGGDASGAAIQLGKALNDPIKGLTALTRVGVSFTAQQKDQIAAMVKAGDTIGAQKIILAELNKEFGGSAAAYGKTLPGEIDKAKRHFEDFTQQLATDALPIVSKTGEGVLTLGHLLADNKGVVLAFVGAFAGYKAVPLLIDGIGNAYLGMAAKVDTARTAITALGGSAGFAGGLAIAGSWGLAIAGAGVALNELSKDSGRTKDAVSKLDQQFKTTSIDALQSYIDKLQAIKADPVKFKDALQQLAQQNGSSVEATYNALGKELDNLQTRLNNITGQKRAAAAAADLTAKVGYLSAAFKANPALAFANMMKGVADAEKIMQAATGESNKTLSGQVDLLAGYSAQADITSQKLRDNLKQTLQTLAGEGANVQKLEAANLDPKFIKALVDKGPEYVAAAASASLAEQKKLNDTYLQGESQRWHTAAEIARAESPKAAQAIAAGQAFTQAAIEKTTQDVQTLNFWLHALQDTKRVTFLSNGVPDVVGDITRINTALDKIGSSYVVSVGGTGRKLIPGGSGADGMLIKGPGGPREDNILIRASAGEAVVPAHLVPKYAPYFASDGIPGFANGGLLDTTVKVDTMGIGNSLFSGYGGIFSGGGGGAFGPGVQQWAGLASQVLAMLGLPVALVGKVLAQMNFESSGNPNAINLSPSDYNYAHYGFAGASRGLMQTIPGTFAAYAGPFVGRGIFDPLANIYAGVNYEASTRGPGLPDFGSGHGYDNGGWLKPGWQAVFNGTGKPENVQSPEERDALIREIKTLQKITGTLADRFADRLDGTARKGRLDARTRT